MQQKAIELNGVAKTHTQKKPKPGTDFRLAVQNWKKSVCTNGSDYSLVTCALFVLNWPRPLGRSAADRVTELYSSDLRDGLRASLSGWCEGIK